MSQRRLEGKVCIVTGSSSGLGRAISLAYAREGGLLICTDLRPGARPEVGKETEIATDELIRQNGGQAVFVRMDVSKSQDWVSLVEQAVKAFGRIDVLVNNAGISLEAGNKPAKIHETPEERWDITMAVNLTSVFLGCKYVILQMLKQDIRESGDRGWIINLSSIYGLVAGNYNRELHRQEKTCMERADRVACYAASKAGVSNLTKQVALDYGGERIHCNAICPGYTRTAIFAETVQNLNSVAELEERHPLRGVGRPQDLVGAAIFLASDDAAWVTGVCLPVDGGYTAQ